MPSAIQLRTTGTGEDGVRYPSKVTAQIEHLANRVGKSDLSPLIGEQGDRSMNARIKQARPVAGYERGLII